MYDTAGFRLDQTLQDLHDLLLALNLPTFEGIQPLSHQRQPHLEISLEPH